LNGFALATTAGAERKGRKSYLSMREVDLRRTAEEMDARSSRDSCGSAMASPEREVTGREVVKGYRLSRNKEQRNHVTQGEQKIQTEERKLISVEHKERNLGP
jgi:hypothetical protein